MAKKNQKITNTANLDNKQVINSNTDTLSVPHLPWFSNQWLLVGILIGIVFIAFASGFGNGFLDWDDNFYVTGNQDILHPTFKSLRKLFTIEVAANYHPLTMITFWLNSSLFGQKATSFIVLNVLIHGLNTVLAFRFIQQLIAQESKIFIVFVAVFYTFLFVERYGCCFAVGTITN